MNSRSQTSAIHGAGRWNDQHVTVSSHFTTIVHHVFGPYGRSTRTTVSIAATEESSDPGDSMSAMVEPM